MEVRGAKLTNPWVIGNMPSHMCMKEITHHISLYSRINKWSFTQIMGCWLVPQVYHEGKCLAHFDSNHLPSCPKILNFLILHTIIVTAVTMVLEFFSQVSLHYLHWTVILFSNMFVRNFICIMTLNLWHCDEVDNGLRDQTINHWHHFLIFNTVLDVKFNIQWAKVS